MHQPSLFDPTPQERLELHRRSRASAWPEWDGPRVGALCEVGRPGVPREDGRVVYAHRELCRIVEKLEGDSWLVVIEMGEVHGRPWPKDGMRLVLHDTELAPPVRVLREARRKFREGEARDDG